MDLEIVWLEKAEENLYDIFLYYQYKATIETARKITLSIIESADVLKKKPFVGQQEELLKGRKILYRYLVKDNYKLIYSVDEKHVYIHLVFDARQNPDKLKKATV